MTGIRKVGPSRRKDVVETSVKFDLGVIADRLAMLIEAMRDWGTFPFPSAPTGFRYKTRAEYSAEYVDSATTAARRQVILAIRCGLLPQETVAQN